MKTPGFNAEASLYETSGRYQAAMYGISPTTGIVAQQLRCPPPGTCEKASRLCISPELTPSWCSIWCRCVDCGPERARLVPPALLAARCGG
jgi:hypothetical protein